VNQNSKLLTREQAAKYLGVAVSTLANWACTKKVNLTYVRLGRSVRYRLNDLDAFIEGNKI